MNLSSLAPQLTNENFRTCYFQKGDLKAFVSEEYAPDPNGVAEILCFFNVTLRSEEWGDMEQQTHQELELALEQLKEKYGSWEFVDMSTPTKSGSCSTCVAH